MEENAFSIRVKQKNTNYVEDDEDDADKDNTHWKTRNVAACRHFVAFATYMHT